VLPSSNAKKLNLSLLYELHPPLLQPSAEAVVRHLTKKIELELAVRAPPSAPSTLRGGDGPRGEDDDNVYLSSLSNSQAEELLNDWIVSTKVCCISDQLLGVNTSVEEVHRQALETLEILQSHSKNPGSPAALQKVFVALLSHDKKTVLAFAAGSHGWQPQKARGALVIHALSVSPDELRKESSVVASRMKQLKEGLLVLATRSGSDLFLLETR